MTVRIDVKYLTFSKLSAVTLLTLESLVSILPFLDTRMTSFRYLRSSHVRHLREELVDLVIVAGVVHSQICHLHRKRNRRPSFVLI